MTVVGFKVQVTYTSPSALRCRIVCCVDVESLRMPLPESLLAWLMKRCVAGARGSALCFARLCAERSTPLA
jgi:hypothetical protein